MLDCATDWAWDAANAVLVVAGLIALATAPIRAWFVRPALEIRPRRWQGGGAEQWTFAALEIRNAPLLWILAPFMTRQTAVGCTVDFEFRRGGEQVIETVAGRWSAHGNAVREVPVHTGEGIAWTRWAPEDLIEPSKSYDLPPSSRWYEVAAAILLVSDEAYAWGARSYRDGWQHPDRKLERGEYDVTAIVRWGDRTVRRTFRLSYVSPDFGGFEMENA